MGHWNHGPSQWEQRWDTGIMALAKAKGGSGDTTLQSSFSYDNLAMCSSYLAIVSPGYIPSTARAFSGISMVAGCIFQQRLTLSTRVGEVKWFIASRGLGIPRDHQSCR